MQNPSFDILNFSDSEIYGANKLPILVYPGNKDWHIIKIFIGKDKKCSSKEYIIKYWVDKEFNGKVYMKTNNYFEIEPSRLLFNLDVRRYHILIDNIVIGQK